MHRELTTTMDEPANAQAQEWAGAAGKDSPPAPATSRRVGGHSSPVHVMSRGPVRLAGVALALAVLGFGAAFALGSGLKHRTTRSTALPGLAPVTNPRGPREVPVRAIAPAAAIPPLRRAAAPKRAAGAASGSAGQSSHGASQAHSGAGSGSPQTPSLGPSSGGPTQSPNTGVPVPAPTTPSSGSGSSGSSSSSGVPSNPGTGTGGTGHGGGFKPAHCAFCTGGSA